MTAAKCPRCKRELRHWPLKRPNSCAPADWKYCIREVGER